MKSALLAAINDYPGFVSDLSGCVNDVSDWASLLRNHYGFLTQEIYNEHCTRRNITDLLTTHVKGSKAGDVIAFVWSGHGSFVPDVSGDEPDGRDETICLYDAQLTDDDISKMLDLLHPEARLIVISDSCHSGSVAKAYQRRNKFRIPQLPPTHSLLSFPTRVKRRIFRRGLSNVVTLAACGDGETAAEAVWDGQAHGAFSYYAIKCLTEKPDMTYAEFATTISACLPVEDMTQHPVVECSAELLSKKCFS